MNDNFMAQHGIGTFTDPQTGKVVTHSSLPDDVKSEVQRLGALRQVAHGGGVVPGHPDQYLKQMNRLYDPKTRQGDMATITIQRALQTRLDGKKQL